jgi:predicted acylesterase/phospholipase RssA
MLDKHIYNTLVLGGGAVKAIATLGALFYLQEVKQTDFIENYVGTSAGAIICYLSCIGYTPFEIIRFLCMSNLFEEIQNLRLANILERRGVLNYYVIHDHLEKLTLNKIGYLPTLSDIRNRYGKNLTVVTFNLTKGVPEYLSAKTNPNLPCLTALRMSSNIPLLFDRFFYNNYEYIDGGFVDNFPINHLQGPEYKIIAIRLNPSSEIDTTKMGQFQYLMKVMMSPHQYLNSKENPEQSAVIMIHTDTNSFEFNLTVARRLNIFSQGYQAAKLVFEPPLLKKEEKKEEEETKEVKKEPLKEEETKEVKNDPLKEEVVEEEETKKEILEAKEAKDDSPREKKDIIGNDGCSGNS